jgi:hypothetical protein
VTKTLAAILLLAGCGSSQQRKEGVQQLEKLETDVHSLRILVSAGVTKQEYSQKFEDVLVRLGDLDQTVPQTLQKFPDNDRPIIKAIYGHLAQSMAAYRKARDYFGASFEGYGCEDGCSYFRESDYNAAKQEFPTLAHLDVGPEFTWYRDGGGNVVNHAYRRSDMLQALWTVAGNEDEEAKQLIDQISQK